MKDIVELENRLYHSHQFVAAHLGVDPKPIKAWVRNGGLPRPIRLGRHSYFDLAVWTDRVLAYPHPSVLVDEPSAYSLDVCTFVGCHPSFLSCGTGLLRSREQTYTA
jgi:hypothetical protein